MLFARNENESRQVASLTKIMTAYVIFHLLERYGLNEQKEMIKILPNCATLNGTSANLLPGDTLSAWELLHGMMLPSGNDSA